MPPLDTRAVAAPAGLRAELRRATQAAHAATEAAFAPLLSAADGLDGFLRAQQAALATLHAARDGEAFPEEAGLLPVLLADLEADLAARGLEPLPRDDAAPMTSLAVAYLVFGSRLGSEVIRREQMQADRPLPRYLRARDHAAGWRAVCTRIDAIPPGSEAALRLVEDVARGFAYFRRAALSLSTDCPCS